jgi:plasmid replication initiation protein
MTPYEYRMKKEAELKAQQSGKGNIKKIHNSFIQSAIHGSNYQALKVIFYLSSILENLEMDKELLTIIIDYEKALEFTGITDAEFTRTLRAMQSVSITFVDEVEKYEEYINLMPRIKRLYGKKQVEINMFPKVARLVIDVPKQIGGTMLNVKEICKLKSKHSLRLLPILYMINGFEYPAEKKKTYSLEELNDIFGVSYKKFDDIEKRILKDVQHELNTTSKIGFTYEVNMGYHGIAKGRPKALSITITPVVKKYVQGEFEMKDMK